MRLIPYETRLVRKLSCHQHTDLCGGGVGFLLLTWIPKYEVEYNTSGVHYKNEFECSHLSTNYLKP